MELLPQEHVFKPESSLITQLLTASSVFKVQRLVAQVANQMTFATTILQNPVPQILGSCSLCNLYKIVLYNF